MSENSNFPNHSGTTLAVISQLAREREDRRKNMEQAKKKRLEDAKVLASSGKFGDSDFVGMIERYRQALAAPHAHVPGDGKINVAVRKRPVSERERAALDHDAVTCSNPLVVVHHCKLKVDGITKALENTTFQFDHAFDEHATNEEVYEATCLPLVEWATLHDGRSTCFAYGQTGSGKTYTMEGLHASAARDVFACIKERKGRVTVKVSFFELYGSQCLDLLNDRRVCLVREDGKGEVKIDGLGELAVDHEERLLQVLAEGALNRTTRSTEMNADSSRSHAIFQISLSSGGKLSLIDLAGSERGQDTKNHDATRRTESAAINRSLLALKECIRALDPNSGCAHVPYRGSKLTMVLKDSFAPDSRTVMISCVSPAASSSDHTLNTLRYADRVKEKDKTAKSPKGLLSAKAPSPFAAASATTKSPFARAKSPGIQAKSPVAPKSASTARAKSPAAGLKSPTKRSRLPSPPPAPPLDEDEDESLSEEHKRILSKVPAPQPPAQAAVAALIDEEEEVLSLHAQVLARDSQLLADEGKLLARVNNSVDYDIEEYLGTLSGLIEEKLSLLANLKDKVVAFQGHLRAEENLELL